MPPCKAPLFRSIIGYEIGVSLQSCPAGKFFRFIQVGYTMKFRQCIWALLLAGIFLSSLGISDVNAFPQRRVFVAPVPGVIYFPPGPLYPYYYNAYAYNTYVMPLPAYGILPPPLATMNMVHRSDAGYWGVQRTAEDYGYQLDTPARKRTSLYPAVPFEKLPEVRLADLRRVRFEITVPFADAVVYFDGAKTKQTGLRRIFVTPPMQEDKEYTATIMVQWTKQDGTLSAPRQKTFTVVAGETVPHTFIE
jgi:uncharacterized protein (TIGR03000 family)